MEKTVGHAWLLGLSDGDAHLGVTEDLIPPDHPIRKIRLVIDAVLAELDDVFDEMYSPTPSPHPTDGSSTSVADARLDPNARTKRSNSSPTTSRRAGCGRASCFRRRALATADAPELSPSYASSRRATCALAIPHLIPHLPTLSGRAYSPENLL